MPRFDLIDQNSGYGWGEANAETPVAACAAVDAGYGEHGPYSFASRIHTGGYLVHAAPADFPEIVDGQDEGEIACVEALPRISFVETVSASEWEA
jgi:hypothetical protein